MILSKKTFFICKSFQRAADSGSLGIASNWQMIPDKRNWNHVIKHYIERGLIFDDPRRPELIKFYLREIANRANSKIIQLSLIDNRRSLDRNVSPRIHLAFSDLETRNPLRRITTQIYYCLRLATSDFLISSPGPGLLNMSDIRWHKRESSKITTPSALQHCKHEKGKQYQEVEITSTVPGDMLNEKESLITVFRTYFARVTKESPDYELDLTDLYCVDEKSKSIEKCQVNILSLNPSQPILRMTKDGKVLLDDEITAPSFFQLNEKWWAENDIEEEIAARAKRTNRYVTLKLRLELQMDPMNWQGPNIGDGVQEFTQGGDHARHLEALGRYRTGLADGLGEVWLDRSQDEIDQYELKKKQEEHLIERAGLSDSWLNLNRMTKRQMQTFFHDLCISARPAGT